MIHQFDTVIVDSGGSGLYSALEASQRSRTAVLSKLYPIRSHTGNVALAATPATSVKHRLKGPVMRPIAQDT